VRTRSVSRKYSYRGEPNTCLWCGRKFTEQYRDWYPGSKSDLQLIVDVPRPGSVVMLHGADLIAREVIPFVSGSRYREQGAKKDRRARPAEVPEFYRVYFDPPVWNATYSDEPYFDTLSCGSMFGLVYARGGQRLKPKETLK
jgi:hypothetical protein